jgi:hypothetical protein
MTELFSKASDSDEQHAQHCYGESSTRSNDARTPLSIPDVFQEPRNQIVRLSMSVIRFASDKGINPRVD